MHRTVDLLLKGDPTVLESYRRAVEHWKEIWMRPEVGNIYTFTTLVSDEVPWFERNCGGEDLGQEIMVLAGFGMHYTPGKGFGEHKSQVTLLDNALQMGAIPARMRVFAQNVASSYKRNGELAA